MALFDNLFSPSKQKKYLIGLLLKQESGVVMIFEKDKEKIIMKELEKFNHVNFSNFTEIIDEILFKLESKLQIETSEIIFFLYSHLIEEKTGEIKKEILMKIKKLIKELNLKPIGYIEVADLLSTYYSYLEKIPFTSLILELDLTFLTLFVYKGGKLFLKKTVISSEDIVGDILSILKQKKDDFLVPTRLIVYNSNDIEDYFLKILHYQWPENIFIQAPKMEIIKEEEMLKSIIFVLNQQLINEEIFETQILEKKNEKMGFVIGEDILEIKNKEEEKKDFQRSIKKEASFFRNSRVFLITSISKILQFFKKIWQNLNNLSLSKLKLLLLALISVVIFLFINEYFFHKAKIIIYSPTKKIKQTVDLDLNYIISTFSSTLKEQKATTGKKTIGEKATGEVIVYNTNLNKEKIIKKGTEVETGGLKFVFNKEVVIASAESATIPGKAIAKLIASQIGEEYNIPKGKKFNIDDTSYAESTTDFKGGSKKQIKVISQKDIEELENLILNKGKSIKNPKTDNNKIVLTNLRKINIEKKEINGEVGEEADFIGYKATLIITDFYIVKDQLLNELATKLKKVVSNDYYFDKNKIIYQIKDSQLNQEKIYLKIDTQASFIKRFDVKGLLKDLKGKSRDSLKKILKEKYQVLGYQLIQKSLIPQFDYFLPIFEKNIEIEYSHY